MSAAVSPGVDSLVAAAAAGRRLLLLFDFDGTLSPTVAHPEQARLPTATRQVLAELEAAGCQLGVLSSRSLGDLRGRVDLPGAWLAGSGGLELWVEGRPVHEQHQAAGMTTIAACAREVAPEIAGLPGAWLERKPLGLTIHHHGASPETVGAIRKLAAGLQARTADVRVAVCTLGVEIAPCPDVHKGTAVAEFIAAAGGGLLGLFYAGNEANDAEAMAEVIRRGGWVVGVGAAAPPAHERVSGPTDLRELLANLVSALGRVMRGRGAFGSLR
jgi:trehalose-phosphatase